MTDWLVSENLAPDADDEVLGRLYAAAARGELALPFCSRCDQPLELDQGVCDNCHADAPEWRAVEPAGVVHSATLVHRLEPGLITATHPYPVLDIETTSGHRVIMTTRNPAESAPAIGSPVAITFRTVGGVALPAVDPLPVPDDSRRVQP